MTSMMIILIDLISDTMQQMYGNPLQPNSNKFDLICLLGYADTASHLHQAFKQLILYPLVLLHSHEISIGSLLDVVVQAST